MKRIIFHIYFITFSLFCFSQNQGEIIKRVEITNLINSYIANNYEKKINIQRYSCSIVKCRLYYNCPEFDTPPKIFIEGRLNFKESPIEVLKHLNGDSLDTLFLNNQLSLRCLDLKKYHIEHCKIKPHSPTCLGWERFFNINWIYSSRIEMSKPIFTKNSKYAIIVIGNPRDCSGIEDKLLILKQTDINNWEVVKEIEVKP